MKKNHYLESDMYAPIKDFFVGMGYDVKGEVKNCDIALTKDGELLIIEMKKSFSAQLLLQALDRQKITTQVYMAIPRAISKRAKKDFTKIKHIAKKLDLGLIAVSMDSAVKSIDFCCFPPAAALSRDSFRKESILREMSGRSLDLNKGGSTKKKIVTAYRERVIAVACALKKEGQSSGAALIKKYGCDKYTNHIMYANFYNWFERIDKGLYKLSDEGNHMLESGEFGELVQRYSDISPYDKLSE